MAFAHRQWSTGSHHDEDETSVSYCYATATKFERMEVEEYSHVKQVMKHGSLENKNLRLDTKIALDKCASSSMRV